MKTLKALVLSSFIITSSANALETKTETIYSDKYTSIEYIHTLDNEGQTCILWVKDINTNDVILSVSNETHKNEKTNASYLTFKGGDLTKVSIKGIMKDYTFSTKDSTLFNDNSFSATYFDTIDSSLLNDLSYSVNPLIEGLRFYRGLYLEIGKSIISSNAKDAYLNCMDYIK